MLQVSERAKEVLKETLLSERQSDQEVFRLQQSEDRLGLTLATAESGDVRYEHEGTLVMVAESELANALDGITIDCEDRSEGPALVITQSS